MCIKTQAASNSQDAMLSKKAPHKVAMESDDRPLVSDLLKKNAKLIDQVREKIKGNERYDAERYDDIWILRFVLSHKKAKPATEAAIKTMKHRAENKLNEMGDIRHKVYNHELSADNKNAFDIHKAFNSYWLPGRYGVMHTLPDPDRGVVSIIMPGHINIPGLNTGLTPKELANAYLMVDECIFQIMDEVTRRTGHLTKLLRVLDMQDLSIMNLDRNFVKRDATAAKANEDFYPQLLGAVLVVNAPGWLNATWAVLKNFFPKRVVAKFGFVAPKKSKKDVQRFEQYWAPQNLPERYGGSNTAWPPKFAGDRFQKTAEESSTDC